MFDTTDIGHRYYRAVIGISMLCFMILFGLVMGLIDGELKSLQSDQNARAYWGEVRLATLTKTDAKQNEPIGWDTYHPGQLTFPGRDGKPRSVFVWAGRGHHKGACCWAVWEATDGSVFIAHDPLRWGNQYGFQYVTPWPDHDAIMTASLINHISMGLIMGVLLWLCLWLAFLIPLNPRAGR